MLSIPLIYSHYLYSLDFYEFVFACSVKGVYYSLGSLSPQQRFEMMERCCSSVTTQFYWQAKYSTPLRHDVGPIQKEIGQVLSWLLFLFDLSPPAEPTLCKFG